VSESRAERISSILIGGLIFCILVSLGVLLCFFMNEGSYIILFWVSECQTVRSKSS
jgi:hypothetical protein